MDATGTKRTKTLAEIRTVSSRKTEMVMVFKAARVARSRKRMALSSLFGIGTPPYGPMSRSGRNVEILGT